MKKAQETTMAVLIIALAIAIILISAWGIYSKILKTKTDIEACRLSVLGKSHTKPGGKSPLELRCGRVYVRFFNDKVISTINGRESKVKVPIKGVKKEKFDELTDDIVFHVFAEELRNCWYKMGGGDYLPFDQQVMTSNSVCLVCSIIDFEKELKEQEISYEGFETYLNDTLIPGTSRDPGYEVTYADYLSRQIYEAQRVKPFIFKRVAVGEESALEKADEIVSNTTYYVVYQSLNPTLIEWNFIDDFRTMFGGTEKDEIYGAIWAIDASDIGLLDCDLLYN